MSIASTEDFTRRLAGCLVDWREVDAALERISPDCCMDNWIRVGMALHSVTGGQESGVRSQEGFERWERWSARGQKYREGEPAYRWSTFKQDVDGIGLGSLFVIAKEHGYARREIMPLGIRSPETDRTVFETRPPTPVKSGADIFEDSNEVSESVQNRYEGMNGHVLALPTRAFVSEPAIRFPDMTEGGKVKATCANAIEAIRGLGLICEGDRFHERYRVAGQVMEQWAGELSDAVVQIVRVLIRDRFKFDPGKQHTSDALEQECLCHSYHPIKNYFDSLQWDGVPRLDTWMHRYLGASDDAFNKQVSRLSLIAAVRRILQPGCKFDHIIVLEGAEGRGKSSAIEILAGRENFSDQEILTLSEVRQQEALQGVWLYEIADLQGHSRADVDKVKAFASRTTDRARPAYGRYRADKPRTCVIFASTNETTYLLSQTGNRRFWPVACGACDLEALKRDRDQLWAEAVLAERSTSLVLDPRLWTDASERQERRREHDPWEDKLSQLEGSNHTKILGAGGDRSYRIASRDILDAILQIPAAQQAGYMTKRIARIMRLHGWEGPKTINEKDCVYKGYTKNTQ